MSRPARTAVAPANRRISVTETAGLVVHQIPSAWGLPTIGPFSLKLETYLRLVGIPYEVVFEATPFSGPKGKLPWIEHEGQRIGDSGFIIEYLERRFGCDPNAGLDAAQRATALALRRLIEDDLYWTLVYDRWLVDENWPTTRGAVLGRIPAPLRPWIAPLARRGVRRQLAAQGMGRHTREEIHAIGIRDVGAIADLLGERPFLMGDAATEIDAVAYGLLANIALVPIASPVKDAVLGRANLVAYLERMGERYFG
jgi:glutathione S-transferase